MDGAPPHFHQGVRLFLNNNFPNRWIGRGSTIEWPPRSPDLTVPGFFLWEYVKDFVFLLSPTTPENMKKQIREAFQSITPQMSKVAANFQKS